MPLRLQHISLLALFSIGLPVALFGFPVPDDIPVRSIGHGLLVAPVSINGQGPFDFIIDTGTNTTLFDPVLAQRLGLVSEGLENLKTLTGATPVQRYHLASLAVGSKAVHNLPALGQSMHAIQTLDKHINGILGLEFLAHFSFGLDYAQLRLRLYDAAAAQGVHGGQSVAAHIVHDRLLLAVAFAETAEIEDGSAYQDGASPGAALSPTGILSSCASEPTRSPSSGPAQDASRPSRAASTHVGTLALDSGVSQILLFAARLPGVATGDAEKQGVRPQNCLAMLDPDSLCREGAARAAARKSTVRIPASQAVRVTTNQAETLSRSIVLQSVAIGDLQLGNLPAVLLSGDVSTADPAADGLLPACLFRSIFFDRTTSTLLLNPD